MKRFTFSVPQNILFGEGVLKELPGAAGKLGGKHGFIISGPTLNRHGVVGQCEEILTQAGIAVSTFCDTEGNPSVETVERAAEAFRASGADFIVALGGGSPMDVAKAVGVVAKYGGSITEYEGADKVPGAIIPLIAIPTTAGTGSEATQFTIITDTRKDIKMLLKGKVLIPSLAIIDPQFTMTAPPKITAATGLDALCHAVEAYTSRKAQTLSDTFAMSAVKRIFKFLPVAFHDGKNEEARVQMSVAALEAGIAFNNSSVTLIHGMSRPIGALFHVAHGLSNAMLMKECLSFALEGAYDRFADLGRAIGVATPEDSDQAASEKFLDAVVALTEELETPTLAEFGIDKEKFFEVIEKMAYDAMDSGSPQNTQRTITQADVEQMYKNQVQS